MSGIYKNATKKAFEILLKSGNADDCTDFMLGVLLAYVDRFGRRNGPQAFAETVAKAQGVLDLELKIQERRTRQEELEREFRDSFARAAQSGQDNYWNETSGGRNHRKRPFGNPYGDDYVGGYADAAYSYADPRANRHRPPPEPVRPDPRHWSSVLGVARTATKREITKAYRKKATECHPDKPGGSQDKMTELNLARDRALKECTA